MKTNLHSQGRKNLLLLTAFAIATVSNLSIVCAGDDRHGDDTGGTIIRQFDSKGPKVKSIAPIVQKCSLELAIPIAEHALGQKLPPASDQSWRIFPARGGIGAPKLATYDVLGTEKDSDGRLKSHYYVPEATGRLILPNGEGVSVSLSTSVWRSPPREYKDLPSTEQKPKVEFVYLSKLEDRATVKLQVSLGPIRNLVTDQYSYGQFDLDELRTWLFQSADSRYDGKKLHSPIDIPKVIFDRDESRTGSFNTSEVKSLRIQSATAAQLFVDSASPVQLWTSETSRRQAEQAHQERLIKGEFVPTQLRFDFEGYEACVRSGLSEL